MSSEEPHNRCLRTTLDGGLGNQLFMWAASFAIAKRTGLPNFFEIAKPSFGIDKIVPKDYLRINSPLIEPFEEFRLKSLFWMNRRRVPRVLSETILGASDFAIEKDSTFDESFLEIKSEKILIGYFHSWRYFEEYRNEIREILQLPNLRSEFTVEFPELGKGKFLAIHARRGDYLSEFRDYFGIPSKEYYERSIDLASKFWNFDSVVVFSDEVREARKVIPSADRFIGPREQSSPARDLAGMGMGSGLVCSNSTFSWWAAYLHENEKINAIFPYPWYKDNQKNTKDLIHPNWVQLGKGDY